MEITETASRRSCASGQRSKICITPSPTTDRPATADDATDADNVGGMVGVVPGGHTAREPRLYYRRSATDGPEDLSLGSSAGPPPTGPPDTELQERWLDGKVDPATGRPLQVVYPALPPGSLLCFVHHMPHGVTRVEKGTRWALLLTYRTMDPSRKITCTPQVPWDWVERRNPRHGRPDALTSAQYALFADAPEFGGHGPQGNYAYASPAEREQLAAACGK